jgi:hypothetical protein
MWIRIRWIRMFLGLSDPDPSLFCTVPYPNLDPNPDPSTDMQTKLENLYFLLFCDFLGLLTMKID